jgi:hypothetical protein
MNFPFSNFPQLVSISVSSTQYIRENKREIKEMKRKGGGGNLLEAFEPSQSRVE